MASYTTNYNLYKPANNDPHGDFITEFANNMDIIDRYLGSGSGGVKILENQSLSFTGLVATVSDSDITADSNYIVYYHDVTLAENAGITTVATSGVITFTAVTAPSNTIVVDIVLLDVNGGGGGSGGHTIIDDSGNDMPQEAGLQFTGNVNVTDDSVNGKTIVDISGGGGNVYGAFVDTSRVLLASTAFTTSYSYTATEDCFVCIYIVPKENDSTRVLIDGQSVTDWWRGTLVSDMATFYVKEGQIISVSNAHSSYNSYITVYGLKQGTNGIFAPVIFSDNERCIGVWRDNKPLYQRTYAVTYGTSDNRIQLDFSPEVLMFVSGGTYNKQTSSGNMVSYGFYVSSTDRLQIYYQSNSNSLLVQSVDSYITGTGYVTIRYTKTTDVAGSGNWNTDGVPTIHYSTSEQVIGTWIDGKTIYQRVLTGLSLTTSRGTAYTITIQNHGIAQFIDSICLSTQTRYRTVMHPPTWLSDANTIVIRSEENDTFDTLIIQYTKA